MKDIEFSVVIPAYNAQNTIKKAIDSCLGQKYLPKEVIVVNDCSTDKTIDLINTLYGNNPRIKVCSFEKNQGVSVARNFGWNQTTGDFVAFLDSDDIWHTEKLEIIKKTVMDNPEVLCIGHNYTDNSVCFGEANRLEYKTLSCKHFLIRNYFNTSSLVVSNVIKARFDEKMGYTEDHDLCLRISEYTKIYYINDFLTLLGRPQLSKGGLSGNRLNMRKGEIHMYYKFCKRHKSYMVLFPVFVFFSLTKYLIKFFTQR